MKHLHKVKELENSYYLILDILSTQTPNLTNIYHYFSEKEKDPAYDLFLF